MPENRTPSDNIRQLIPLIFALGGTTLPFFDINGIATLLAKHADDVPPCQQEELRNALGEHPEVTTTNGNYYTCHDPMLIPRAMDYLGRPQGPELALRLARAFPFANTEGTANPDRLNRDVRNALFSKDPDLLRKCLEALAREIPNDFATGKPFWFLAEERYLDWMMQLPDGLLSLCLRMILPHVIADIVPSQRFLDLIMPRFNALAPFAKFPVIDVLLAAGRLEQARQAIAQLINPDEDTVLTRRAWMDFLQAKNKDAILKYSEALENIRRSSYGNDFFFGAITGLFFIFALIRENTPSTLGNAYANTRIGLANPLYAPIYKTLHAYLENIIKGTPIPPAALNAEHHALVDLVRCIVAFWNAGGKLQDDQIRRVQEIGAKAAKAGFHWIEDECRTVIDRTHDDWIPTSKTAPETTQLTAIVDCVKVLPPWTKELNAVAEELEQFARQKPTRAAWMLSFSPYEPTEIQLELCEQHVTKTERWSTGHRVYLDRLARDIKQNGAWPPYFSLQDIKAAQTLLALNAAEHAQTEEEGLGAEVRQFMQVERLSHNDILLGLKDYPRVFWKDDPEQTPVKIILDQPFAQVKVNEPGKIFLTTFPKVPQNTHLAAVRYEDDSLHLFCFNQMQKRIANALEKGVKIPEQALPRLDDSCLRLANIMRIKSEHPLDTLTLTQTCVVPPQAIIRLERKQTSLEVELLMQPLGEDETIRKPGDGPQAIITLRDGKLIRQVRDTETERCLADEIMHTCTALTSYNMTEPYHWSIENGEAVFQFMMQLRNIMQNCKILWKQERKLSLSRNLSFGDVRMKAQRVNNWLEVDGEIIVDENLTLSFQKLLELAKEQKGNFIALDDGQVLSLADDLRNTLDSLNRIGQNGQQGHVQFNPLALPALQIILDSFTNLQWSEEWESHVKLIDEAQAMKVPPPPNLAPGTVLRDYQLEGYRWLVRLDHWGAGACLADDMGLGKTIQAIAFILAKADEGPALVVAPTSVCPNWIGEIQKFAPSLQTVVFGQGNRKEMLRAMKPGMVMISSYGLLQSQIASFDDADWRVVILDEAQAIKHYQAKRSQAALRLKAKFKIATTGTPIENNLGELWTLFQFITPGLFGTRQAFQDKFTTPIERDHDTEAMQRLSALIKPFLLRRKKDEILKELPPKTEVQLHVDLSKEERAFYEAVRQNLLKNLDSNNNENSSQHRIRILAAISKLRQAACNPLLVEPGTKVKSAKLEEFKQLVLDLVAGGHKTLVFSQFVRHLDIIRPCLHELNITYDYLDGETPTKEREIAVRNFQQGNSDLFLISLRAGGLGLNLTRADYVIILDPWWNPAVEEQAADRAHRLGQKRPVTIYRLIAKNTIEDKIIELHKQKQDLAVQLLDGADTAGTISAEELLKLLQDSHA